MPGIFTTFDIGSSALQAQRARMNVHANNLANINSTHNEDGKKIPYRRKRILFAAGDQATTGSDQLGVRVTGIEEDFKTPFRRYFDKDHPDADENGYVTAPNISAPLEMVNMMMAQRMYQANLTSIEVAKETIRGALHIIA